jgi:hypothetical protein
MTSLFSLRGGGVGVFREERRRLLAAEWRCVCVRDVRGGVVLLARFFDVCRFGGDGGVGGAGGEGMANVGFSFCCWC